MVALSGELISGLIGVSQEAPARHLWIEYDKGADVLYISFRKPQNANDSIMEDNGNIYHYRDEELVGITVLHASEAAHS
jgi:uncharacterized protein YuzE